MIPKKIHYCWLSGDDMLPPLLRCIDSWKRIMPDYEIILWDTKKFNIESIPFVNEACSVKKWAFACDYIRLYALYTEGGIYLDSDVLVRKPFTEYLNYDFFTAVEYIPSLVKNEQLNEDGTSKKPSTAISGIGIQAAVLGATKGHSFIKACMDYYVDKHFLHEDGSFHEKIIAPSIYAIEAEKYGFRYINKTQYLEENMLILPSKIIASNPLLVDREAFAIHCCAGSWWKESESKKTIFYKKIKNIILWYFRRVMHIFRKDSSLIE